MADEQKNFSGQVNALATRVAQEFKAVKASSGSGAKPWPAEWTSFDQATTEGTYYLTKAQLEAIPEADFPDKKADSESNFLVKDVILRVTRLDGTAVQQEIELAVKVGPALYSSAWLRKGYIRVLPGYKGDNSNYIYGTGYPSEAMGTYTGGALNKGWTAKDGLTGNIGYAPGYMVPYIAEDRNSYDPTGITISSTSPSCNYYGVSTGQVEIPDGNSLETWVKYIVNTSSSLEYRLGMGDKWKWAGGEAPTLGKGVIVACWCHDMGVAAFIPSEAS